LPHSDAIAQLLATGWARVKRLSAKRLSLQAFLFEHGGR
jgi:hypothetical protein